MVFESNERVKSHHFIYRNLRVRRSWKELPKIPSFPVPRTMKFHGKSRIRQPSSVNMNKRFELSGNRTRATPPYPRVVIHATFAYFTLDYRRIAHSPCLLCPPSLSLFIFTFIPNRQTYLCYSLSLNITTFRSANNIPHTGGGGIECTFSQKYASLLLIRTCYVSAFKNKQGN